VRAGIQLLVEGEPDFEVVGTCASLDDLFIAVDRTEPQVVVTDIRMPPRFVDEGIEAARKLRLTHPNTGVVVLSQYSEPAYLVSLIEHGSAGRGYLLKERIGSPGELTAAIRSVASGSSHIDATVVEQMVAAGLSANYSPLQRLTEREREVLSHVAAGQSNAGIARALFITDRAVEKHINSIFTKLDLLEDPSSNRRVKAVIVFINESASK
jgi:DNA-binding NarL/FixJ family response regulator